jgi:hypothetical protein
MPCIVRRALCLATAVPSVSKGGTALQFLWMTWLSPFQNHSDRFPSPGLLCGLSDCRIVGSISMAITTTSFAFPASPRHAHRQCGTTVLLPLLFRMCCRDLAAVAHSPTGILESLQRRIDLLSLLPQSPIDQIQKRYPLSLSLFLSLSLSLSRSHSHSHSNKKKRGSQARVVPIAVVTVMTGHCSIRGQSTPSAVPPGVAVVACTHTLPV